MTTSCSTNLYTVNFTDSRKDHILISKGELITDRADIAFLGKTNRDYGEIFDENTLHLLENFACPEAIAPRNTPDLGTAFGALLENPVEGQIWFNTTTNRPFRFDGVNWLSLSTQCDIAGNYGVLAHGGQIPLPVCQLTGYVFTWEECTWVVSPFHYSSGIEYMRCATDEEGNVTMQYSPNGTGGHLVEGSVNYQIIGIRGNNNLGTGGTDPLPTTPIPPPDTPPIVTTPTHKDVSFTTATLGATLVSDGGQTVTERGTVWGLSNDPTTPADTENIVAGSSFGAYTGPVADLPAGTEIFYRGYAINTVGTGYSDSSSFTTTAELAAPTVTTVAATGITNVGATLNGNVTSDGGATITERGIYWATSPNPLLHQSVDAGTTGSWTDVTEGMQANTLIYFRAFATNSVGTSYSADRTFTTESSSGIPLVINPNEVVNSITDTTAGLTAEVSSTGGLPIAMGDVGAVWSSTNTVPNVDDDTLVPCALCNGPGGFSVTATGLPPATLIYWRGYAINTNGPGYTITVETFTTEASSGTPAITEVDPAATNITSTSAVVHANVISTGGSEVGWERGAVWAEAPNYYPTIENGGTPVVGTGVLGLLDVTLNGLPSDTNVYFSLYAKNEHGPDYTNQGGEPLGTSPLPTAPLICCPTAENIQEGQAELGAWVTGAGGYSVDQRGIYWGTSPNPLTNKNGNGTGTGIFSELITGLPTNGETIYYRGYAHNFAGWSYTDDGIIQGLSAPTVQSPTWDDVTHDSATLGATVSDFGGQSIDDFGIVWGYSSPPTTDFSMAVPLFEGVPYSDSVAGLFTGATEVFIRGYAENGTGRGVSDITSFTTSPDPTPDTTGDVIDGASWVCSQGTAVSGSSICGTINSNGYFMPSTNCPIATIAWVVNPEPGFSGGDYSFVATVVKISSNAATVTGPASGTLAGPHSWCMTMVGNNEAEFEYDVQLAIEGPQGTAIGTVVITLLGVIGSLN